MNNTSDIKIKIEHPYYNNNKIGRPNKLLIDQIKPFNPAVMMMQEDGSYMDKQFNMIIYRKEFRNKHENCLGERYYIITSFLASKPNKDNKYTMIKIQFVPTFTTLTVTYKELCKGSFYDPYYKWMYNNTCCIGNIDYTYYQDEYDVWNTFSGRCFDPSNSEYPLYGGDGLVPASFAWTCFEYFHIYNERQKRLNLVPIYDPNDAYLYQYYDESPLTTDRKRFINGFPYKYNYSFPKTKRYLKDIPFDSREYHITENRGKVGRPVGSINKPKPKQQMINVINPNADLLFEERMRRNIINTTIE